MAVFRKIGEKITYIVTDLEGEFEGYWQGLDLANYVLNKHGEGLKIGFEKIENQNDEKPTLKLTILKGNEMHD